MVITKFHKVYIIQIGVIYSLPDAGSLDHNKNCNNIMLELGHVIPENIRKIILERDFKTSIQFVGTTDIELDEQVKNNTFLSNLILTYRMFNIQFTK